MSILLEALRKSEAQRQLGKAPTLDSPSTGEGRAGDGRRIWIPAVMLSLAAVIIGWIGLAQFERPETVAADPAPTLAAGPKQRETEIVIEPVEGFSERSAKTPVMNYSAPEGPTAAAADRTEKAEAESAAEVKPAANVAQRAASRRRPSALTSTGDENSATAPDHSLMPGKPENNLQESGGQRTDRVEPHVADSISYWRVPQSVREELPELHISVLVYAENPADRFVLLNGQRLREKEALESGMVLDEIQRDRAIFNYRNYRFYLKN